MVCTNMTVIYPMPHLKSKVVFSHCGLALVTAKSDAEITAQFEAVSGAIIFRFISQEIMVCVLFGALCVAFILTCLGLFYFFNFTHWLGLDTNNYLVWLRKSLWCWLKMCLFQPH